MKKLFQWVAAGMATAAGKMLMVAIVGAFAIVLIVVPRGGKMGEPAESEAVAEAPVARESEGLDRGRIDAPPVTTAAPQMEGPNPDPWIADSLMVCSGLSSWESRFGGDSLTPALQASLDRLRLRCSMVEDSTE